MVYGFADSRGFGERDVLSVHHAAGGVFVELQELADFLAFSGFHFVEDVFAGFVFQFGECVGGFIGRHLLYDVGGYVRFERFEDTGLRAGVQFRQGIGGDFAIHGFEDGFAFGVTKLFDDLRQIGGVHALQLVVRDVEAQAALGVGFDDAAEIPRDGVGADGALHAADDAAGDEALEDAAHDAADADIDFEDGEVTAAHFKSDIVDADDFAAVDIDDLLIQQVAADAEHVLIGVVGHHDFIVQADTGERDFGDLAVAHGEPGAARAYQEAIHAGDIDQGDDCRIFDAPNEPPLQVIDRKGEELREI